MQPLDAMIEAARQAGALLLERQADLDRVTVEEKGMHDFVTDIDRASEDLIVRCLEARCPGIPFLAEESGERKSADQVLCDLHDRCGAFESLREGVRRVGHADASVFAKRGASGSVAPERCSRRRASRSVIASL